MKRWLALLLAGGMLLTLAACGKKAAETDPEPTASETEGTETFAFTLADSTYTDATKAEDGTVVAESRYTLPKLVPDDAGALTDAQSAAVAAFNAAMDALLEKSRTLYEALSADALEDYAYKQTMELEWTGRYEDEVSYTASSTDRMIALNFADYTNSGGPYPAEGNICFLFDLAAGEMVAPAALTNDGGASFRTAVGEEILRQIDEQGLAADYYDDYRDTVYAQSDVQYWFQPDGVTVYFQEFTLAPHAAGRPSFAVPLSCFAGTLNDRGWTLLGLSGAALVLASYQRAAAVYGWFALGTAPVSEQSEKTGYGDYYRLDYPGVTSRAELETFLNTLFAPDITARLLKEGKEQFIDLDGALYCLDAARGSDITLGEETDSVTPVSDTAGTLDAVVEVLGEDLSTVTDYKTFAFPYEIRDGRVIFTAFPYFR